MNLPNSLTLLRIFLTLVFIVLFYQKSLIFKVLTTLTFMAASYTDYLDGYLARKNNLVTDFGKIMDPIADKFLILSAFFMFSKFGRFYFWCFVIIAIREISITVIRLIAMKKGEVLAAEKAGKYKTLAQVFTIFYILVLMTLSYIPALNGPEAYIVLMNLFLFANILVFITVLLTLFSGLSFLWNNKQHIYVR